MNWHKGNIAEAVAESKAKDAVFVVFIEGNDELSGKLERFVDDVRVRSRLETPDFVAIKVQGNSSAYGQFMSLYKVVPIPSLFFIGKTGTPLEIATGITDSVDELTAKIDKVLVLAGKRTETPAAATSSSAAASSSAGFVEQASPTAVRSFAGADDTTSLSNEEAVSGETEPTEAVSDEVELPSVSDSAVQPKVTPPSAPAVASFALISAESSASSLELAKQPTMSATALAAEKRASAASAAAAEATAASKVETATTSGSAALNLAASIALPAVPLLTPAVPIVAAAQEQQAVLPGPAAQEQVSLSNSEARMAEVQSLLEQKRRERLEEEKRREKENEIRRRREGRQAQSQQALAKEQELKNMQERIRRERQEEQAARERIRAQIAADRAEQAHRVQIAADATSTSNSVAGATMALTTDSSMSSVDETRLQIRLPGGINRTKSFPVGEVLGTVRIYVRNEMLASSDARDFTLAASYPRREFHTEDEVKTLSELKLVPNAVVLVLAKEHVNRVVRSGGSLMSMLVTVIWAMITPAAKAFEYINQMGLRPLTQKLSALMANFRGTAGGRANVGVVQGDAASRRNMDMFSLRPTPPPGYDYEESENLSSEQQHTTTPTPQPQPGTGSTPPPHPTSGNQQPSTSSSSQQFQQRPGGYQPPRYGDSNIRRLHDTKKDDNEKDKATYNGNSTQQQ